MCAGCAKKHVLCALSSVVEQHQSMQVGAPGTCGSLKAMLLSREALGTVGTGTSNLRRPMGITRHAATQWCGRGFRSGKQPCHTESVIFEGARGYPAYLIYFAAV